MELVPDKSIREHDNIAATENGSDDDGSNHDNTSVAAKCSDTQSVSSPQQIIELMQNYYSTYILHLVSIFH